MILKNIVQKRLMTLALVALAAAYLPLAGQKRADTRSGGGTTTRRPSGQRHISGGAVRQTRTLRTSQPARLRTPGARAREKLAQQRTARTERVTKYRTQQLQRQAGRKQARQQPKASARALRQQEKRAQKQALRGAGAARTSGIVSPAVGSRIGVLVGASGAAVGISLATSGVFFTPTARFWGSYRVLNFGWGPCWFYPSFGLWFYPGWGCWYYPLFRCWYFPYDSCWFYPWFGCYVRIYHDEPEPYILIKNERGKQLYFAVYHKERDENGKPILQLDEAPRYIRARNSKIGPDEMKLLLKDRGPQDIIVISREKSKLHPELTEKQAAELVTINVGSGHAKKEKAPAEAIRFDDLNDEQMEQLQSIGQDTAKQKVEQPMAAPAA